MSSGKSNNLAIVLAAGEGTRMRSRKPKVMQQLGSAPLISHVLNSVHTTCDRLAVVIGPQMDGLEKAVRAEAPDASIHVQTDRLGTAHAAQMAMDAVSDDVGAVFVLFGDTPLVRRRTIETVGRLLSETNGMVVVGFEAADPTGYGRLLRDGERLIAIREEAAATDEEKRVTFCNSGIMAFSREAFQTLVPLIGNDNPKREFYLTDAVELAEDNGFYVTTSVADEDEVLGINSRDQLAVAELAFQSRRRAEIMAGGVTLVDPASVFFAMDTAVGQDTLIEPNVFFGPGVSVGEGATIRAYSHLEGASVGTGAQIGPFARLRPGTELGENTKVGNFVETKKARVGVGAKLNHLSYLGDADIGAGANIGAGTITCNYDGFNKHQTTIGTGAFIGSNSALVAPVTIGNGAFVGSGSVVTDDVPDDALGVARGRQKNKDGWAALFRAANGKP
ncbi:MAG: bifunctional UDP-N-acetylglucosamine diphosphorylase/glucosamine-1-phosphate N-acetyltransferase GlmU [Pseudomonadota bacterium]